MNFLIYYSYFVYKNFLKIYIYLLFFIFLYNVLTFFDFSFFNTFCAPLVDSSQVGKITEMTEDQLKNFFLSWITAQNQDFQLPAEQLDLQEIGGIQELQILNTEFNNDCQIFLLQKISETDQILLRQEIGVLKSYAEIIREETFTDDGIQSMSSGNDVTNVTVLQLVERYLPKNGVELKAFLDRDDIRRKARQEVLSVVFGEESLLARHAKKHLLETVRKNVASLRTAKTMLKVGN